MLLAALLLRLWLALHNSGLTMDSPLYVEMAEDLLRGHREVLGPAHGGYPALIALVSLVVTNRELPGRIVSLAAGLLLVPLVYLIARRTLSPAWSSLAAWLVALHPLLAVYSGPIMTETSFLVLAYAGLWMVERGRTATGGALLGLGYWVRPESLVFAPVAALSGRLGGRATAKLLLVFGVAMLPHLAYLRWEYGHWTLTPKSVLLSGPLEHGVEREPVIRGAMPAARPQSPAARLARWLSALLSSYLPNLLGHLRQLVLAWPLPLAALSLLGLWKRRGALMAPLPYLLVLPLFAVVASGRFPMLQVPALAVFAAAGAADIVSRVRTRHWRAALGVGVVVVVLIGLRLEWAGPPGFHALNFDDGPMPELRAAGEWLGVHGRPGALVMDRKPYVPFYAGMRQAQLPDDTYDRLIDWARTSGVDYLVLEEFVVASLRPQFVPLLADERVERDEHRLRRIYKERTRERAGVAIFEVVRDSSAAGAGVSRR